MRETEFKLSLLCCHVTAVVLFLSGFVPETTKPLKLLSHSIPGRRDAYVELQSELV